MNHLQALAELICDDMAITLDRFFSKYSRGKASRARHLFALAATDAGLPHLAVSSFLQKDPSYVTQVRRRKYIIRQTVEYHHALGYIKAKLAQPKPAFRRQRRLRYANT